MRPLRQATLVLALLASTGAQAAAQDAAPDAGNTLTWRTSIKIDGLLSRPPDDRELFPERGSAESLWRVRTEPQVKVGNRALVSVAYEQRVRWQSGGTRTFVTNAVLPAQATAPFRVTALDWTISGSGGQVWQHEIDRLNLQLHLPRTDLTVGRQAIGWGRGVMFGAVDLFAPFSPLEADREWRRGVDAIRADVKLTDRSSVDIVTAVGRSWDASALAARVRGYAGPVDLELMGGRRGRDLLTGVASSAAIGDAAVHGEAAVFRIPSTGGAHRLVWKGVAGGSYRVPWGSGVIAYAEYHFSGFGTARAGDILSQLSTPDFSERYLRGDTQILSRHAVAVTASYEQSPDLVLSGQWVLNPADRSGLVVPGLSFTIRQDVSVAANVYLPYGQTPVGARLRSEYGAAPLAALLQLRIYF